MPCFTVCYRVLDLCSSHLHLCTLAVDMTWQPCYEIQLILYCSFLCVSQGALTANLFLSMLDTIETLNNSQFMLLLNLGTGYLASLDVS